MTRKTKQRGPGREGARTCAKPPERCHALAARRLLRARRGAMLVAVTVAVTIAVTIAGAVPVHPATRAQPRGPLSAARPPRRRDVQSRAGRFRTRKSIADNRAACTAHAKASRTTEQRAPHRRGQAGPHQRSASGSGSLAAPSPRLAVASVTPSPRLAVASVTVTGSERNCSRTSSGGSHAKKSTHDACSGARVVQYSTGSSPCRNQGGPVMRWAPPSPLLLPLHLALL